MVEEQLTYFQKLKFSTFSKIPKENLLRAKTNSDFDPNLIYTPEEAQTMLKFAKNSMITIMAAFTSEWLLGYLSHDSEKTSNKEKLRNSEKNLKNEENIDSEVKIFPLMMVSPLFSSLVPQSRGYEIKFFSVFGVFKEEKEKDSVSSSIIDHIFQDSPMKPKAIYQAIKDFNFLNSEEFLFEKIELLSLRKGDLISVTKMPNSGSWAEGFVINKEVMKLGIFHVGFATLIKFKMD